MLAMLDRPTLRLTVQGLGLPGGAVRFECEVVSVTAERRGPYELAIQLFAPLPRSAAVEDVRAWMKELALARGVSLAERANSAEPRKATSSSREVLSTGTRRSW
jgi:hypothetical protein